MDFCRKSCLLLCHDWSEFQTEVATVQLDNLTESLLDPERKICLVLYGTKATEAVL